MSVNHNLLKKYLSHIFPSLLIITVMMTGCTTKQTIYVVEEPTLSSINIIDRNGMTETINNPDRLEQYDCVDFLQPQPFEKVLRIYNRDNQGNISACITSYHPNGYPHQYLEVVNSRACGAYKEWYPNGVQKILATIIEGTADLVNDSERTWIFDGDSQVWDETGYLIAIIPYNKGNLEGVSIYYHGNGNTWKTIPYCKNNIHGLYEIFCEDSSLLQSICYVNGQKEGESKRYWDDQCLAAEEVYCEGLLSFGRYYNKNAECIASIDEGNGIRAIFGKETVCELQEYHYGILEGEVKILDRYGRIIHLYNVKKGSKHGEEIYFYDGMRLQQKLNPKISIYWYEDKIQGIVKTWYDNKTQESQREMSNNKKNGHSTVWYRDGSLMMIEEYDQDKLKRGEYYTKSEKMAISIVDDGNGFATIFDGDGTFLRKIEYRKGKPQLDE